MNKRVDRILSESRMFTAAIIATMTGTATAIAFGLWHFLIVFGHDSFIRFFENSITCSFIGLWLGGTAVGLKLAAVFLKKNSEKVAAVFAAIAIFANLVMVVGSIGIVLNHYSVQFLFKGDNELIALLNDPNQKWAASHKLGKRRVAAAVPALCGLLEDVEEEINLRHNAAIALGRICAPPYPADVYLDVALESLIATMKEADDLLLSSIATALGEIKDERAVVPLGEVVWNESRSRYTRMDAARAMGNIGGAKALSILSSILEATMDSGLRENLKPIIHPLRNQEAIKSMKETLNP
jgi:hypothetical protein